MLNILMTNSGNSMLEFTKIPIKKLMIQTTIKIQKDTVPPKSKLKLEFNVTTNIF
jgi:hypothetical protein